ncbi:MAG: CoA transferase [Alphaproteobacteria bacterium]|nr:CoA transferase [Alphaproteobacteria bacterium]
MSGGALSGVKIVEFAGIGPAPFCCMLLADMGADVVRIDRREESGLGIKTDVRFEFLNRNKRSIALDLKSPADRKLTQALIGQADAVIEGFRPGVMERLGLGPEECWKTNPRLVFGRMTGWGQEGPLAQAAGHDLNYIALVGALNCVGPSDRPPPPPLNLIGDFGGGALYLAMGVLAGLLEARQSGKGQVVDAAMVDGVASLMTIFHGFRHAGLWSLQRDANVVDGGAPYYRVYETADGKYVSLAAIERKFFAEFLDKVDLKHLFDAQNDKKRWPELHATFGKLFRGRTRAEWVTLLEGSDSCFAPVLDLEEAQTHPHNALRRTYVEQDGLSQPAPAPRFSRTPSGLHRKPPAPGQDEREILKDWAIELSTP